MRSTRAPDKYKDKKGNNKNPRFNTRMEALEKELKKQIKRIENYENTELLEIYNLYYNEN